MRVLHLVSEKTWRGGENQLRLLIEQAQANWFVAAPPGSEASQRLAPFAQIIPLAMDSLHLLPTARKLVSWVDRAGIQLVDCQSSKAHNLGLLLKLFRPQLKLVVHRRVDYPPGSSWINRRKYLSPKIDRYVCISAAIAGVLRSYGVSESRLRIVPSAVDASPFRAIDREVQRQLRRAEWQIKDQCPIIGNVAYLTEQKDHGTLIRALGLLKARGIAFFCFIAGTGSLEAEHKDLAAQLGLGPRELQFVGVRRDIPQLLAAADIFALSSQDEGLGTSLLDAAYSGCALLATDVGGIPEIVRHEATGLLVPRRDPERFAAALERLLLDPELRLQLAKRAEAHADLHFSLKSMVEGNLAVYRELLEV